MRMGIGVDGKGKNSGSALRTTATPEMSKGSLASGGKGDRRSSLGMGIGGGFSGFGL